jgi:hypothetical protein
MTSLISLLSRWVNALSCLIWLDIDYLDLVQALCLGKEKYLCLALNSLKTNFDQCHSPLQEAAHPPSEMEGFFIQDIL